MVCYSPRSSLFARQFGLAFLLAGAMVVIGCGGPAGPTDVVTGKVTMNGQGVKGTIVFVSGDGTSKESPITPSDGSYMVTGTPKGEVSILVKGFGTTGGMTLPTPKDGAKDAMSKTMGGTSQGVAPPAKYAKPNNGLPKLTITGGKQTHNVELTP